MTHKLNEVESIDGSWRPRPAPGLVALELDGELVLLDPRTDGLHQLDRLGAIIWKVLDGKGSVDELVTDLAEAFGTPADVVRADLEELLTTMRSVGLLAGTDPPSHLLVGSGDVPASDGIWRPEYLVDPPAP